MLKPVPEILQNHRNAKLLCERWNLPHNKNDMYSAVFCGKPGVGKSWSTLDFAWLLDRDSDGEPRFDFNRVCFSATQFSELLSKGSDMPAGTAIILDDAGLALYSKETLSRISIELGKAFQSMRYKNLVILLNLPSFGMLEAHVRKLLYDYVEIVGRRGNQNLAKIQKLQLNPFFGKVYRHGLATTEIFTHPDSGMTLYQRRKGLFKIDRPPRKLVNQYEARKKHYLDKWSEESHAKLALLEQEQLRPKRRTISFAEVLKHVRGNITTFANEKGKVEADKILGAFDGEKLPTCGLEVARLVAKNLNTSHTHKESIKLT